MILSQKVGWRVKVDILYIFLLRYVPDGYTIKINRSRWQCKLLQTNYRLCVSRVMMDTLYIEWHACSLWRYEMVCAQMWPCLLPSDCLNGRVMSEKEEKEEEKRRSSQASWSTGEFAYLLCYHPYWLFLLDWFQYSLQPSIPDFLSLSPFLPTPMTEIVS